MCNVQKYLVYDIQDEVMVNGSDFVSPVKTLDYDSFRVVASGTSNIVVKLEGSIDNDTWYEIEANTASTSANYIVNNAHSFHYRLTVENALSADPDPIDSETFTVKVLGIANK